MISLFAVFKLEPSIVIPEEFGLLIKSTGDQEYVFAPFAYIYWLVVTPSHIVNVSLSWFRLLFIIETVGLELTVTIKSLKILPQPAIVAPTW